MPHLSGHPRARRIAAAYLTALQAQGVAVGVGHHQSVQELLNRLPEGTSDQVLGDSLVAVFATSAAEQQLGRSLFRQSLAAVNAMDAPVATRHEDPIAAEDRRDLRRLLLRLGGLALAVLALLAFYLNRPPTEFLLADRTLGITVGTRTPLPDLDSIAEIGRVGAYAWPAPATTGAPLFGRLDTVGGPLVYEAPNDTVRDAFTLTLTGTERRMATVTYRIVMLPDTARPRVPSEPQQAREVAPPPSPTPDFSPIEPLPYPRNLADLAPAEARNGGYAKFLYYGWWPLMALIGGLLMVGLYLLLRYLQRRKLRLVAQREQSDGAPHFWRVELPELRAGIDWGANYPALLRQLRRRREDDHRELDLNQTIARTIARGGLPSFEYRSATRPAEYLLLIDRGGANNHHARLFEQLYQQLAAEEVLVERYFYDGDPRLLYQDDRARATNLTKLQRRFPNARLLLVGSGDRLIHPATGKLAKWVEPLLGAWTSRSLLTTLAPSEWGRDERRLAAFFSVLPASIQGLRLLAERINDGNSGEATIDYRSLIDDRAELAPVNLSGSLIGSLERSFTVPQLQWIAACALYPTLHWDLTLFFGQTISETLARRPSLAQLGSSAEGELRGANSTSAEHKLHRPDHSADGPAPTVAPRSTSDLEDSNLLSSQNLLSLSRLPWFINGSIPPAARDELTEWLQRTYPALHRELRRAMLAALGQTAPPPVGSVAHRELDFFRLQNEWLLAAPASPERARLAEELAQRIANGNDPDITVARFLDSPPADAIVLPQRWNARLYPEGLRGLGVKPEVKKLWWGVPLLLLLACFGWFAWPDLPPDTHCDAPLYPLRINAGATGDTTLQIQLCDKRDSLILADFLWERRIGRAASISTLDAITSLEGTSPLQSTTNDSAYFRIEAISVAEFLALTPTDSLEREHRENVGALLWNRGAALLRKDSTNNYAYDFLTSATELISVSEERQLLITRVILTDSLSTESRQLVEGAIASVEQMKGRLRELPASLKPEVDALIRRIDAWIADREADLAAGVIDREAVTYYRVLKGEVELLLAQPPAQSTESVSQEPSDNGQDDSGSVEQQPTEANDGIQSPDRSYGLEVRLYNRADNSGLSGGTVKLYTLSNAGERVLVEEVTTEEGNSFSFLLAAGKKYEVSGTKPGYTEGREEIDLTKYTPGELSRPQQLKRALYIGRGIELKLIDGDSDAPLKNGSVVLRTIKGKQLYSATNPDGNDFYVAGALEETFIINTSLPGYYLRKDTVTVTQRDWVASGGNTLLTIPLFREELQDPLLDSWYVRVYFPNDYPDPNTFRSTTTADYDDIFVAYVNLKDEYTERLIDGLPAEEAFLERGRFRNFFDEEVRGGKQGLDRFLEALLSYFSDNEDQSITLAIDGFTSPRGQATYNNRLSSRRCVSVINYIKAYQDGRFLPLIKADRLSFLQNNVGDSTSQLERQYERLDQPRLSIYSVEARLEDRVEIRIKQE